MSRASKAAAFVAAFLPALVGFGAAHALDDKAAPRIGTPVSEADLSGFLSIHPDGRGLPPGSGTVAAGKSVFDAQCASCHGEQLQGGPQAGAPALAGGRGTLAKVPPKKTVESYWPYATTLFDYIKRAMPFDAPGSLSDDQVYALCAYILAQGHVVGADAVMDRASLPEVAMPNAKGFRPFPGPERSFFR